MSNLIELHKKLVQTIIDFYQENPLPEGAWALDFNIDDLPASIRFKKWHASSDSLCLLKNINYEDIETSV